MRLKKAVVVQCRLGSTRLKNKALKEIDEKTILEYVLNSMKNVVGIFLQEVNLMCLIDFVLFFVLLKIQKFRIFQILL